MKIFVITQTGRRPGHSEFTFSYSSQLHEAELQALRNNNPWTSNLSDEKLAVQFCKRMPMYLASVAEGYEVSFSVECISRNWPAPETSNAYDFIF